jgi:alpha-tubulin suppressor-like RCC1 family protein
MPALRRALSDRTIRIPSPTVVIAILVLGFLALCAGCGDTAGPPEQGDAPVTTIRASIDSTTLLEGGRFQLSVSTYDSTGAELAGRVVTFRSARPAVAAVAAGGLVTARSFGRTAIVVESERAADTVIVRVQVLFRSVSAGGRHSCGISRGGRAYCWGNGAAGQLGNGTIESSTVPALVTAQGDLSAMSAGLETTCGIGNGTAYCWGSNGARQLGTGAKADAWTPVAVAGGYAFEAVGVNTLHACGITAQGQALCWGADWAGQIGNGVAPRALTPEPVAGGLTFQSVAPGWLFTCGITTAGAAYCWGFNETSQLGVAAADEICAWPDGADVPCSTDPVPVATATRFATVVAGSGHACALTPEGAAYCWGDNGRGQLGDGTTERSWTPTAVVGGLSFVSLTAGDRHTCGVTVDGHAWCWGDNGLGALGTNATFENCGGEPCATAPVASGGTLQFAMVSASTGPGSSHTCGVTPDGHAYCWGRNDHGQLGAGYSGGITFTPVPVAGQPK